MQNTLYPQHWREDLAFLLRQIEETHPYPFGRISRQAFRAAAAALRAEIPHLAQAQIVVRLMQLVASLEDGHTTIKPLDPNEFNRWYPLRFYAFADGLYLTAAGPAQKALIGAQVLRIGELPALDAARAAATLQGANNEFARREHLHYLSNAAALHGLGITPTTERLRLQVRLADGTLSEFEIGAVTTEFSGDAWMYWGEMYGPPGMEIVALPGYLPSAEFRQNRPELPLHLRCRIPFFAEYAQDSPNLYMQFNFVQNWGEQTFRDFYLDLFATLDRHPPERFILDLRYNSGGNGGLLIPFVHEFIRRDAFFRPGRLIVLVGRKTFSAAVLLIGLLKQHVQVLFAGEPAGAPLNHFGDALNFPLPHSRMDLQVSSLYHQMSKSDDRSRWLPIHYPALFDSRQYFSGQDPVLEMAISGSLRSLPHLFWEEGREVASAACAEQTRQFSGIDWWEPFSEIEMNSMGYRLLAAGRGADAIAAFSANTQRYPASANTWDSLAEAYLAAGDQVQARASYAQALALNPGNAGARAFLNG